MHDVVSDILTNDMVPHDQKRAAILEAGSRYRDASSFLMPVAEWATMGEMMGVANMGGPSVGILPGWPTPTLARGASMADAMKSMSGMAGMQHGAPGAAPAMPNMPNMPAMKMSDSSAAGHAGMATMPGMKMGDSSAAMSHGSMAGMPGTAGMNMPGRDAEMMRMHERMMRDPVIRQRVMADTAMRRMMTEMQKDSAGMHAMHGMAAMSGMDAKGGHGMKGMTMTKKSAATAKSKKKAATAPPKKDAMPGMDMKNTKGMPPTKP